MAPFDWFEFWGPVRQLNVPEHSAMRSLPCRNQIDQNLRIPMQNRFVLSMDGNHAYWSRYENFLFRADSASWTLWVYHHECFSFFWLFTVFKAFPRFCFHISLTTKQEIRATIGCQKIGGMCYFIQKCYFMQICIDGHCLIKINSQGSHGKCPKT
jgi:hypothetical protein